MELKNRSFQYGKVALAVRTQYHQLVCAESSRHLHRNLLVSCADRTFSAAAGLPVCRPCSVMRQSAAEVGPVLNKTSPCQEIPPTTFWHCNPYSVLKLYISIPLLFTSSKRVTKM